MSGSVRRTRSTAFVVEVKKGGLQAGNDHVLVIAGVGDDRAARTSPRQVFMKSPLSTTLVGLSQLTLGNEKQARGEGAAAKKSFNLALGHLEQPSGRVIARRRRRSGAPGSRAGPPDSLTCGLVLPRLPRTVTSCLSPIASARHRLALPALPGSGLGLRDREGLARDRHGAPTWRARRPHGVRDRAGTRS